MDEVRVLHVLCQTLQKAQRLVENHRHCDLGEFLKNTSEEPSDRVSLKKEILSPFTKKSFENVIFMLNVQKAQGKCGLQKSHHLCHVGRLLAE